MILVPIVHGPCALHCTALYCTGSCGAEMIWNNNGCRSPISKCNVQRYVHHFILSSGGSLLLLLPF